ncbi:MAG: hypothetical protein IPI01_06780 [Ignavibacteriae bacterium]|nr:hypothetical protein [Ignavibacteriota bacterium]
MKTNSYGSPFERVFVALIAIATGLMLVYLAVEGPTFLNQLRYKTPGINNNQIVAQDLVNVFLLSPLLIAGGVTLFFRRGIAPYLLMMTPLYLIYFVLSYTLGMEWSSTHYSGNSEQYTFHFLFILVSALIILLYGLSIFPGNVTATFRKTGLIIYSIGFPVFLLVFASMWIKEVLEVIATGTTRAYDASPTMFWVVRMFDLGFSIPLGLISVYLLWTRPRTTFPVQFLFYGFFLTMIVAVNAMGWVMWMNDDPTFMMRDLIVFLNLGLIIVSGFVYVLWHYRIEK